MATALDMITQSLRKMGVYAPGETISDADAEQGLTTLNDMMDMWSNESLMCYAIIEQSGALTPGQYSYTVGPGGDFDMTRPLKLIVGPGAAYMLDSTGEKYDLEVVAQDQWNLIGQLQNIDSNIPNTLFYDPQFPLGILNFYPTPNVSITAYWDSYLQLSEFANLIAPLNLPPGYKKAIQDNLLLELVPFFKEDGFQAPQLWIQQAATSKGIIKRTNLRPQNAYYDPEITSRAQGTWNIYTSDWN